MKRDILWKLIGCALMLAALAAVEILMDSHAVKATRINPESMVYQLAGNGTCIDADLATLTNEATSTVTTRCKAVQACVATIDNSTGVAPDVVVCEIQTQSGTTMSQIDLQANNIAGTASGATVVSYWVFGTGSTY